MALTAYGIYWPFFFRSSALLFSLAVFILQAAAPYTYKFLLANEMKRRWFKKELAFGFLLYYHIPDWHRWLFYSKCSLQTDPYCNNRGTPLAGIKSLRILSIIQEFLLLQSKFGRWPRKSNGQNWCDISFRRICLEYIFKTGDAAYVTGKQPFIRNSKTDNWCILSWGPALMVASTDITATKPGALLPIVFCFARIRSYLDHKIKYIMAIHSSASLNTDETTRCKQFLKMNATVFWHFLNWLFFHPTYAS